MTDQEQFIQNAIFTALDEINLQRPKNERIAKSPDTALIGVAHALDSLEVITLFVTIEEHLSSRRQISISLAEQDLLSVSPSPFASVGALARKIAELVS